MLSHVGGASRGFADTPGPAGFVSPPPSAVFVPDDPMLVRAVPDAAVASPPAPAARAARKVSPSGEYLRYPGVTVACDVIGSGDDGSPASALPALLRSLPTLGALTAPLPASSYHVTALDVACQHPLGLDDAQWAAYCAAPRPRRALSVFRVEVSVF